MDERAAAKRLAELLERREVRELRAAAAGRAAHLVGGVVRDRLLEVETGDLDAVVAGDGEAIAARLAERLGGRLVALGGERFAAYRVVVGALTLDLWDRVDTSLTADLARRDFTVNALALDLATGELADPFAGLVDLGSRRLRAVTGDSFSGDPLRVLRLPRFLVQLWGFTAEPATVELARAAVPGLERVATERVREELDKTFTHRGAHRALALLADLGIYPRLWRGEPPGERPAGGDGGVPASAGAAVAALEHLDRRPPGEPTGEPPAREPTADLPLARWALTFLALAAGPDPRDPELAVEAARRRGLLTRERARRLHRLLAAGPLPTDELSGRRFLHRAGTLWPTAVAVAVAADGSPAHEVATARQALLDLARTRGPEIFDPPQLLTGDQVQKLLGIAPGPAVGEALQTLREAQIEGRVVNREEAIAVLKARGCTA